MDRGKQRVRMTYKTTTSFSHFLSNPHLKLLFSETFSPRKVLKLVGENAFETEGRGRGVQCRGWQKDKHIIYPLRSFLHSPSLLGSCATGRRMHHVFHLFEDSNTATSQNFAKFPFTHEVIHFLHRGFIILQQALITHLMKILNESHKMRYGLVNVSVGEIQVLNMSPILCPNRHSPMETIFVDNT